MIRSLNGLRTDSRTLNGLSSDKLTLQKLKADLPLEYDENNYTYSIKGLNSLGSANQILKMNSGGNALEWATDTTTANSTEFGTTAGANINIGNASYITKIMGNINVDGTLFTILKCGNGLEVSNGNSSQGMIFFKEDSDNGSNYIMLHGQASLASNFTLTMPSITDTLITKTSTDTLTNKSGNISQWTNDSGFITASSSDNLSNKTFTDLTNFNASLSVKDSANFSTGSVRFYDADKSHYTEIYAPTTLLANHGLQLPNTTGTLALSSAIPDLTTAFNFGTSATDNITIGASNRTMTMNGTDYTFNDSDGTAKFKISDSDIDIEGL